MKGMSYCVSVIFIALLFVSGSLPKAEAIRCYDCYSLKDLFCNDPFHKNSTASKNYPAGSVCVKLKGNLNKEDGFVTKREGMPESQFDELVRSKVFPEGTEMVKCKTDLCNAADIHTPSVTAFVTAMAVAVIQFWY